MPRQSQFGAHENTASERQHASRLAAPRPTSEIHFDQNQDSSERGALIENPEDQLQQTVQAAPQRAATGGEARANSDRLLTIREVADLLQVPVSWVYGRTRKRTIDRLPGYRLGKYWRFDREQVLAWVERQAKREAA
jgi:excisionase family DNA binding protein